MTIEATTEEFSQATIDAADSVQHGPFAVLVQALNATVEQANLLAEGVRAAKSGDKDKIDSLLNNDDEFEHYRAEMAKFAKIEEEIANKRNELQAAAKKHAKKMLPDLAGIDVEAATAEYREMRKKITAAKTAAGAFIGAEEFAAWTEVYGTPELVGFGRSASGAGEVRRYRFESIQVNAEHIEKPTLTEAAKVSGVPQELIKAAVVKVAGTEELKDLAGTQIFATVEHDNKNVAFVVVPK